MSDSKNTTPFAIMQSKEFEVPETIFAHDIENRVFQGIVLRCLLEISGISLLEGNFIENLFSRDLLEGVKGIHSEQDSRGHAIHVKIELNVHYGVSIPEKAEEIHSKIASTIAELTGVHVASVQVVFKNITFPPPKRGCPILVEQDGES